MLAEKCHFCGDFIGKHYHYPVHFAGTDVRRRVQNACAACVVLLNRIEEAHSFNSPGPVKYAFAKNFADSRMATFRKSVSDEHCCDECGQSGNSDNKIVCCGFNGGATTHYCEECLVKFYRPLYTVNFAGQCNFRHGRDQQLRAAQFARRRRAATDPAIITRARQQLRKTGELDALKERARVVALKNAETPAEVKILTPREIKAQLDLEVVGQEAAKKKLAVTASYYCKQVLGKDPCETETFKSNVLLLGGTGSGKTLLAKTLAKVLEVPFVTADATTLTQAGYRGNDVEGILSPLIDDESDSKYSSKDGKRVRGVVFVDEVDKMIEAGRDGHDVQHEFLKICEGTVATVPCDSPCKNNVAKICYVDTRDILFIFAGSFPRLKEIINRRIGAVETIGFGRASEGGDRKAEEAVLSQVTHEDLHKFGFSQELLGRIPIVSALMPLERHDYIDIFTKPKSSVFNQFSQKLKMWNANLRVTPRAVEEIVDKCSASKLGARALFSTMEQIMSNALYEIPEAPPGTTIVLDLQAIKTGTPRMEHPKIPPVPAPAQVPATRPAVRAPSPKVAPVMTL